MDRKDAQARVARGAAHLDRVRPGWELRIDVGVLDIADIFGGCVIGQLFPEHDFCGATEAIGWKTSEDCSDHGVSGDGSRGDFPKLQDAWIDEIAKRRYPVRSDDSARHQADEEARATNAVAQAIGAPVVASRV